MGLDIGNLAGDNLPAFIMALAFGVMIIGIGTWAIGALNDNTDNPTSDLWTSTNNILTPTNLSDYIMTNNSLIFNNDSNYGYLSFNNITDNRYWNLPDKNGILATLNDINFNILKDSNNLILADGVHSEKVLPDMNLSPEVLTDTSFESWGLRYVPDNWDSENGNPIRLTGLDVRTGTYAL